MFSLFYPDYSVEFGHCNLFRAFNRCGHLLLMLYIIERIQKKNHYLSGAIGGKLICFHMFLVAEHTSAERKGKTWAMMALSLLAISV